ncbi:MAG: pilus assembly protein [Bryobacteraceae bacterium]|nr:pilus assembly protein [Bryobacteraceae bacterium]MDW8377384.1 pilus assembly protein [Bryobacterales bacterium]
MRKQNRKSTQSGHAIMEFALMAMPLITFLLGVTSIGFNLGRAVQVAQVCRDASSMYVRGVDFSHPGNQAILIRLGEKLGMANGSGRGVVILSKVTYISQSTCNTLGLPNCNGNKHVITQRIVVGNPNLRSSLIGTPNPLLIDSKGLVRDYMTEPTAVANFSDIQLYENEFAYVVETFFSAPDLAFAGFSNGIGNYMRAVF